MNMKVTPYAMLNGTAKDAIHFYEQVLGAEVLFKQTFGEGPEALPDEAREHIAHSVLRIGDSEFMLCDILPGQPHRIGNQMTVCITTTDTELSKQLFDALLQEGHADIPLEAMYFSPAYGMVTDKFGVTFQIFTRNPQ